MVSLLLYMLSFALWYRKSQCKASSSCERSAVELNPSSLLRLQAEVVAPMEREAVESQCYPHQQAPVIAQRSSGSSDVWCTKRIV